MKLTEQEISHKPPDRHLIGVGGIVTRNSAVLLIKPTYGPAKGLWMIPGGFVDTGETLESAIKREVLEETGVEIYPRDIISVRMMTRQRQFKTEPEEINDLYIVLRCDHLKGEPQPFSAEVSETIFLPLEEAQTDRLITGYTRQLLSFASKDLQGFVPLPSADPKRLVKLGISKYSHYAPKD
ncbi:MAG: NUDIX domain-containing protein [Candidatus Heimdallarchaeota archaeon]